MNFNYSASVVTIIPLGPPGSGKTTTICDLLRPWIVREAAILGTRPARHGPFDVLVFNARGDIAPSTQTTQQVGSHTISSDKGSVLDDCYFDISFLLSSDDSIAFVARKSGNNSYPVGALEKLYHSAYSENTVSDDDAFNSSKSVSCHEIKQIGLENLGFRGYAQVAKKLFNSRMRSVFEFDLLEHFKAIQASDLSNDLKPRKFRVLLLIDKNHPDYRAVGATRSKITSAIAKLQCALPQWKFNTFFAAWTPIAPFGINGCMGNKCICHHFPQYNFHRYHECLYRQPQTFITQTFDPNDLPFIPPIAIEYIKNYDCTQFVHLPYNIHVSSSGQSDLIQSAGQYYTYTFNNFGNSQVFNMYDKQRLIVKEFEKLSVDCDGYILNAILSCLCRVLGRSDHSTLSTNHSASHLINITMSFMKMFHDEFLMPQVLPGRFESSGINALIIIDSFTLAGDSRIFDILKNLSRNRSSTEKSDDNIPRLESQTRYENMLSRALEIIWNIIGSQTTAGAKFTPFLDNQDFIACFEELASLIKDISLHETRSEIIISTDCATIDINSNTKRQSTESISRPLTKLLRNRYYLPCPVLRFPNEPQDFAERKSAGQSRCLPAIAYTSIDTLATLQNTITQIFQDMENN